MTLGIRRASASLAVALVLVGTASLRAGGQTRTPTGVVDGLVTDTSLVPLAGATASILGSSLQVVTGESGRFRIIGVPVGRYIVVIHRVGYVPEAVSLSVAGANAVASKNLGGDCGTRFRGSHYCCDHRLSSQLMKEAYLEVTYRGGRAIAAYYYLPRRGPQKVTRTRRLAEPGLIVDLAADGRALGVEITAPSKLKLTALNRVLRRFGCAPLRRVDLAPIRAA